MYDEKQILILQFSNKYKRFEDKTAEIEWYCNDNNACEIKYLGSNNIYHKSWKDIRIFENPQIIASEDVIISHLGKQLTDISCILLFDEWYKVFYKNGKVSLYNKQNIKLKSDKKNQFHIKKLLEYLKFVAGNLKDIEDNDFLLNQLEKLSVQEKSCIYKFLNGKLERVEDNSVIILPFSSNQSQKQAVKYALENDLSMIQGPPGTGKTQTILNILANCILRGQSVAVVSGNNSATQNVYDKLAKEGYGYLNAFLGKEDNIDEFFSTETEDAESFVSNNPNGKTEKDLQQIEDVINNCMSKNVDLAKKKQMIEDILVEKDINDAEYAVKEHKIPQVITKKRYTSKKFLELAAILEILSAKQIKNFFNRARLLFRYGLINLKSLTNNQDDIVEYLKNNYYDKKIQELTDEKQPLEKYLKENCAKKQMELYSSISKEILNQALFDRYSKLKYTKFTKENYKDRFYEFTKRYPIIYSTTHALRSCSESQYLYDYVIIDESSQVDLITATIAFSCAKRVVLVGDEMQITHVVTSKLEILIKDKYLTYGLTKNLDYVSNNILKAVKAIAKSTPFTLLSEHYRCDPQIIGFCNKRFYNNELVIRTEHEKNCGVSLFTHGGHSENNRMNETEVESIETEIIPNIDDADIGIIAPYNNQINLLKSKFSDKNYKIETVHKFQGKECDFIILSTVADKIKFYEDDSKIDFMNNPNLINVAISRAKKRLYISVSEDLVNQEGAIIRDMSKYYEYYCKETKIIKSKIYSVFDLMYNDYSPVLRDMKKRLKIVSKFMSENIIATVIGDVIKEISSVCEDKKYGALCFLHNYPLKYVLKLDKIENQEDIRFVKNPNTHCDFVIYNSLDKSIELVVEVDGKYNHSQPEQIVRDKRKDRLLSDAGIKVLRLPTTSINCREKIIEKLLESSKTAEEA